MLYSYKSLSLAAAILTLVTASPLDKLSHHDESLKLERRQDASTEDLETEAATDQLRSAVDYAASFSAQPTATYSVVSTGASPANAALASYTEVSPGTTAPGPLLDPQEQGTVYNIDHILELQFVVGAFSVNPRPSTGPTSIPPDKWTSASNACFSKTKNYPAQTSVASAFGNTYNLQGIPNRFNGFKQQVFTGRLKSQPNNPSANTYPTDFGSALQKFLKDNEQDVYSVMDDVGKVLGSDGVGNHSAIQPYFTAYAQGEYQSAIDFLSTWVGTSYTAATSASTQSSVATPTPTPASAPATTTTSAPPPPPPPYATGTCSFHLTETQDCDTNYGNNLYGIVTMKDNNKAIIGQTDADDDHPIGYAMDDGNSYSFESKLPHPLVITGEHENDYVQFTYGDLSWQSKTPNGGGSCTVGGWDPRDGPVCDSRVGNQNAVNNMDCSFPC